MRPPVTDIQTALTASLMTDLHWKQLGVRMVQARYELAQILLQIRRIQNTFEGGLIDRHPGIFVERRLGVKGFHLRHAADKEDPDDIFCFGRSIGQTGRSLVRRDFSSANDTIAMQHRSQRQPGEAHADI